LSRILVVDDNPDNRYSLRLLLGGYEVLEAENGEQAIELARAQRPHCILLDVQMPGMDGIEVCKRLRASRETGSIPIILVTAHQRDTDSVVRGLAAGGDDYVTKPVAQQEILARVRAMLRIRELQDRLEVLNEDLEEQVRRRTDELRQIYATVPVGIYTLDGAGRITSFNRWLARMLGYEPEEVVGRGIAELFAPGYDTVYWLDLCRREGRSAAEHEARRRDGTPIPVFDERVVTIDRVGDPAGFTGYIQDMTQRVRAREILKEQEKQAGLGRLAAGVVHEISNPISGVHQYLDAVLKRMDRGEEIRKEEMRRGATVMRDALHRTTDLIQHLRSVARPAVKVVRSVSPMNVVEDLFTLMRHDLHRAGVAMVLQPAASRCSVQGDAGRLSQVFMNLITNARDAMPDGGTLTVDCCAKESTVQIRFKDTGTGIAPENLERVFEFLWTTKGDAGTGFGLSISRDIVREHGGELGVESELGKGSTFTVELPREPTGPAVAEDRS